MRWQIPVRVSIDYHCRQLCSSLSGARELVHCLGGPVHIPMIKAEVERLRKARFGHAAEKGEKGWMQHTKKEVATTTPNPEHEGVFGSKHCSVWPIGLAPPSCGCHTLIVRLFVFCYSPAYSTDGLSRRCGRTSSLKWKGKQQSRSNGKEKKDLFGGGLSTYSYQCMCCSACMLDSAVSAS